MLEHYQSNLKPHSKLRYLVMGTSEFPLDSMGDYPGEFWRFWKNGSCLNEPCGRLYGIYGPTPGSQAECNRYNAKLINEMVSRCITMYIVSPLSYR